MLPARVADVHKSHGYKAVTVSESSPLEHVIARFALNPDLRAIFVVDAKLVYTGFVSRLDLMRWAHLKLFGGKGRGEIPIEEISHTVDAQKVFDLVHSHALVSVTEDDPIQTALDKMVDYDEDVIAVLDEHGRVVGDLTLAEVLLFVLKAGKQADQPEI